MLSVTETFEDNFSQIKNQLKNLEENITKLVEQLATKDQTIRYLEEQNKQLSALLSSKGKSDDDTDRIRKLEQTYEAKIATITHDY